MLYLLHWSLKYQKWGTKFMYIAMYLSHTCINQCIFWQLKDYCHILVSLGTTGLKQQINYWYVGRGKEKCIGKGKCAHFWDYIFRKETIQYRETIQPRHTSWTSIMVCHSFQFSLSLETKNLAEILEELPYGWIQDNAKGGMVTSPSPVCLKNSELSELNGI